jgi:hypothetical protein
MSLHRVTRIPLTLLTPTSLLPSSILPPRHLTKTLHKMNFNMPMMSNGIGYLNSHEGVMAANRFGLPDFLECGIYTQSLIVKPPPPESVDASICDYCGSGGEGYSFCGGCKARAYCSRECKLSAGVLRGTTTESVGFKPAERAGFNPERNGVCLSSLQFD